MESELWQTIIIAMLVRICSLTPVCVFLNKKMNSHTRPSSYYFSFWL